MKVIYRLEHKDSGYGFYHHWEITCLMPKILMNMRYRHIRMPTPREEKLLLKMNWGDFLVGVSNISQIHEWLEPNEIFFLIEEGFFLYKIEVKDKSYIEGKYQTIFDREGIISRVNITDTLLEECRILKASTLKASTNVQEHF